MIAIISAVLSVIEDEERNSRKCYDCVYCKENGFVESNCHLSVCNLILDKEKRKKQNYVKYDLCKAIIRDDCQAENCLFFKKKEK